VDQQDGPKVHTILVRRLPIVPVFYGKCVRNDANKYKQYNTIQLKKLGKELILPRPFSPYLQCELSK
jgi:hypothetical protein